MCENYAVTHMKGTPMTIKLPSILLLSIMLSSAPVTAQSVTGQMIATNYTKHKDLSMLKPVLGKLDYSELAQLEKELLILQLQGQGDDLGPVLNAINQRMRNRTNGRVKNRALSSTGTLLIGVMVGTILAKLMSPQFSGDL